MRLHGLVEVDEGVLVGSIPQVDLNQYFFYNNQVPMGKKFRTKWEQKVLTGHKLTNII